ncbi:TetR/AcrR family transcriptional regulator [Zoogloea sp.]|uniref:TetR/AcrR family transcriptional regulator n=1 Tax=Zoogloea sp. TaxID=49181 RepID=UPI002625F724|nr:TetR/AcrR family transcriptional regulator [Zoogloea sp.]MDD3352077.1 helix-turn-helix domain containing protein [Zoogloea sp.]
MTGSKPIAEAGGRLRLSQPLKSLRTRQQILDATLHCLVDWGYAHTTNEAIAMRAGLSRGAVTHHFPSREVLFRAFADYLMDVRLVEYRAMVRAVVASLEGSSGFEAMRLTLDLMDEDYVTSPGFHALQELLQGARGERFLGRLVARLAQEIDVRETQVRAELLPVWQNLPEISEMLRDLTVYVLVSLTISPEACSDAARRSRLLDVVAEAAARELEQALIRQASAQP